MLLDTWMFWAKATDLLPGRAQFEGCEGWVN